MIARQSDENNPNRPALLVENGDLLITDDGQGEDSLSVAVGDYQENMRWGGAIRTHMGNLTIQGTSVSTDWNAYIRDGKSSLRLHFCPGRQCIHPGFLRKRPCREQSQRNSCRHYGQRLQQWNGP